MYRFLLILNIMCIAEELSNNDELHRLLYGGCNSAVVEQYIKEKFPVNEQDYNGDTTLHVAIKTLNIEAVRLLLPFADTAIQNKDGLTALGLAYYLQIDGKEFFGRARNQMLQKTETIVQLLTLSSRL